MVPIFLFGLLFLFQGTALLGSFNFDKDEALQMQRASSFAQLPEHIIKKIANHCLPDVQSIGRVRSTCRLFYLAFFSNQIKLYPQPYEKTDHASWKSVYNGMARYLAFMAIRGPVVLDLSGNKVMDFMQAKYPACESVKELTLAGCDITFERDNFFDPAVWKNLERLDLTGNYLGWCDGDLSKSGDWYSGANIWPSICALPKLKLLCLRNNRLSALSPNLYMCNNLKFIDLSNNSLHAEEIVQLRERLPEVVILSNQYT